MARILFVCSRPPYPPIDGARLRMFNLAKLLAREHEVDIVAISKGHEYEQPDDLFSTYNVFEEGSWRFYMRGFRGLLSRDPIQSHAYFSESMNSWVQERVSEYDLLFCTHLATAKYAEQLDIPKFIDLVDAVSESFVGIAGDSSPPWKLIFRIEARRAKRYEKTIADQFDECFITTENDRKTIDGKNITVLPNGVSSSLFESEMRIPDNNDIVFLGDLSTVANRSAVTWFVEEIFPEITSEIDNVTFKIVGKSPPKKIRKLDERDDIVVTGFVDDPYEYIRQSVVSVAPVKVGGGIQNKVLESMALGTPVVTTELGATGIGANDGEHLLVRGSAKAFAQGVVDLLEDRDMAHEIGSSGREFIQKNYSWEKTGKQLNEAVAHALEQNTNGGGLGQ